MSYRFTLGIFSLSGRSIHVAVCASKMKQPFTVLIEGNIGAGKTTFLNNFKNSDALILSEPVERWRDVRGNNLLHLMYQNPSQWSMAFQSYVQLTMLGLHLHQTDKPVKLMERSLFSARYIFVENLMKSHLIPEPNFIILDEWFKWIVSNLDVKADLIVYLRTSPEVVYERIKDRARKEEICIPLDYLESLHKYHEDWLNDKTNFSCPAPVLTIDANSPLENMEEDLSKCKDAILQHISVSL